ncbi:MAG TPA: Rne/Rng family ribonuclease [Acetobacteraceae bacterium]|nr:Rne/Rng family ribonuclease [Acetobacteraceae bacterium]
MTKRMLIDATHAEETRVVVLDGNRLEDFDVETSTKRQLKGNIYLAKVVRVEPSLQACFVEYGGNRHGFLAFSEIHPDYYQIPVADRQRLIAMEEEEARREEEEADRELEVEPEPTTPREPWADTAPAETAPAETAPAETIDESGATPETLAEAARGPLAPDTMPLPVEPSPDGTAGGFGATAETPHEVPQDSPAPQQRRRSVSAVETDDGSSTDGMPPDDTAPQSLAVEPGVSAGEPNETIAHPGESTVAPGDSVSGAAAVPTADVVFKASGHVSGALAATPVVPAAEHDTENPAALPDAGTADAAVSVGSAVAETVVTEALPTDISAGKPAADTDPDHDPDPPGRRAQPLIIETETITGPADTEASDEDTELPPVSDADTEADHDFARDHDLIPEPLPPETVGGEPDSADEQRERRMPPRFLRNYKIQEVIRRRQILLVQVVKEERGTKGAALTTYLSLAGRFCVLMPNSPRGGGISRKITSATDRRRLKDIIAELDMPKGMGLIVRTAGANRPKPEIKRDCEYLLRLWDDIREHTMKSVAPALIYEEASLIKRAIRDVYSRDIDEIQVDGEEGWRAAHEFMRMLMPSHAKKVQLWRDPAQPLFARYQVEAQLDAMLQPTVQLRSGGYLVINQAEALVAIDVNSGRATRERNVEEMALRTNLEAADEVARQLRLRDLAGLIVIDFIDMESKKHNAMVERRIKEALKNDRARIQVGHISHFGLLEMSRQRLRPSLAETSFILCPHCGGTGHVRSTESAAIHVLRGIEEEGSKRRWAEIVVHVATPTALYILNHKRDRLREIELRYAMRVTVLGDDTQVASQFRIDRVRQQTAREGVPAAVTPDSPQPTWTPPEPEPEEVEEVTAEEDTETEDVGEEEEPGGDEARADSGEQADRRRRRRRRRRGRREEGGQPAEQAAPVVTGMPEEGETLFSAAPIVEQSETGETPQAPEAEHIEGVPEHAEPLGEEDGRRRRGRRGGRRRRREGESEGSPFAAPDAEQPDLPPVYIGPTPANPFGGQAFDIFDVLEQAEANAAVARHGPAEPVVQQFEPSPAQPAPSIGPLETRAAPEPVAEQFAALTRDDATAKAPVESPMEAPVEAVAPTDAAPQKEQPAASVEAVPTEAAPADVPASAIVNTGAPEPALSEPVAQSTPEAATEPAAVAASTSEVANDVLPEPAIRPILIGSGEEATVEKKRGWWRR